VLCHEEGMVGIHIRFSLRVGAFSKERAKDWAVAESKLALWECPPPKALSMVPQGDGYHKPKHT
jgi:hypothetical protein